MPRSPKPVVVRKGYLAKRRIEKWKAKTEKGVITKRKRKESWRVRPVIKHEVPPKNKIVLRDAQDRVLLEMPKKEYERHKVLPMPSERRFSVLREGLYPPEAAKHPARMNPLWAQAMVQLWSDKGDVILDPMAGIGTTGAEALRLGRKPVLVDIEPKWTRIAKKVLDTVKHVMRKRGVKVPDGVVITGDATKLEKVLPPKLRKDVDVVMFSPPYAHEATSGGYTTIKGGKKLYYIEYGRGKKQIGKIRNPSKYAQLMLSVYKSIFRVLEPGELMVVNVKNRILRGKELRLDTMTKRLAKQAGFKYIGQKKVYAPPTFFRALYERKNPKAPKIRHERFLVFVRPRIRRRAS
ncbi:MAG: hypothetical protein DRN92_02595 [Thermoproteota archaeon]|nr:MAG: hypothetical protein DRN92_02595 [Candidatus Korarchaeota archaeon]